MAVAVNLGTYYVQRGRAREAMRLWTDALSRNPALTSVRINLAVAQYQAGDPGAYDTLQLRGRPLVASANATGGIGGSVPAGTTVNATG